MDLTEIKAEPIDELDYTCLDSGQYTNSIVKFDEEIVEFKYDFEQESVVTRELQDPLFVEFASDGIKRHILEPNQDEFTNTSNFEENTTHFKSDPNSPTPDLAFQPDSEVRQLKIAEVHQLHQCPFCEYTSTSQEALKMHTKIHIREKRYQCTSCPFQTNWEKAFEKHSLFHFAKKKYECNDCNYKTTQRCVLLRHLKIHTGEKPYRCDYEKCIFKTIHKSSLTQHMLIHTGEKQYFCDQCTFKTVKKCSLNRHMGIHTSEKPHNCQYKGCDFKSDQLSNLKRHMLCHLDIKPFECDKCVYKSSFKGSLMRHMKVHTGEKRFKCHYKGCLYKSNKTSDVTRHFATLHSDQFHCAKCDFKSAKLDTLKVHMEVHTGLKAFPCEYDGCGYRSSKACNVARHMMCHSDVKSHQCTKCKFKTSSENSLRKHHMTAHGEQPFQCKYGECTFKADKKGELTQHMLTHSEREVYHCKICDRKTHHKKSLARHMKLHEIYEVSL